LFGIQAQAALSTASCRIEELERQLLTTSQERDALREMLKQKTHRANEEGVQLLTSQTESTERSEWSVNSTSEIDVELVEDLSVESHKLGFRVQSAVIDLPSQDTGNRSRKRRKRSYRNAGNNVVDVGVFYWKYQTTEGKIESIAPSRSGGLVPLYPRSHAGQGFYFAHHD